MKMNSMMAETLFNISFILMLILSDINTSDAETPEQIAQRTK